MNQLVEVTNITNELTDSTSNDQLEIPNEMKVENVKQESDCLAQSEVYIKTEPQEDESDFLVIAGTSHEMCYNKNIKVETINEIIQNTYEELFDEVLQDLLEDSNEIKVETSTSNLGDKTSSQPGQTKKEVREEYIPISDDEELYKNYASNKQDQISVRNKKVLKDKNYICNMCNKTFKRKSSLEKHLLIHSGPKPFTCEICKKSFTQKSSLGTHMLIHSGKKPHVCNVCNKNFRDKSNLRQHRLIHSGEKPFVCKECGKSFTQKPHLIVHKQGHTGKKPFACDLCKKTFTYISHLAEHRRTHTGEKPYSCDVCTKSFAQKSGLYLHKQSHKH